MAMVYQKGSVYEKGHALRNGMANSGLYGDPEGRRLQTKRVILGLKSKLRKHEAEERLQEIIQRENGIGKNSAVSVLKSDDSVTFDWFVSERYLPMRWGQWRLATKDKTEYEIRNTWSRDSKIRL